MKVEIELKKPNLPKFVRVDIGEKEVIINLKDLSEEQINEYAEMVKQGILKEWKEKNGTN